MALPNDGNPITLEPASDSNHAVLHSVKLMEEDVERMLEAGKDLTITLDDSGKGTLKVGKDSRSIHIRPENERNYECYYRDGQRSTMVSRAYSSQSDTLLLIESILKDPKHSLSCFCQCTGCWCVWMHGG